MKFYFDENITPQIVRALEILQEPLREEIEVYGIAEEFGRGVADEEWIPKVAAQEGIVVTQDINIHRTRHQRELYRNHNLGVIFFRPPKGRGIKYWEMISKLLNSWPDIKSTCEKANKPFAYVITPRSNNLEEL